MSNSPSFNSTSKRLAYFSQSLLLIFLLFGIHSIGRADYVYSYELSATATSVHITGRSASAAQIEKFVIANRNSEYSAGSIVVSPNPLPYVKASAHSEKLLGDQTVRGVRARASLEYEITIQSSPNTWVPLEYFGYSFAEALHAGSATVSFGLASLDQTSNDFTDSYFVYGLNRDGFQSDVCAIYGRCKNSTLTVNFNPPATSSDGLVEAVFRGRSSFLTNSTGVARLSVAIGTGADASSGNFGPYYFDQSEANSFIDPYFVVNAAWLEQHPETKLQLALGVGNSPAVPESPVVLLFLLGLPAVGAIRFRQGKL